MKIVSGNSNIPLAQNNNYLKVPLLKAQIKKFPDKEIFVEMRKCKGRRCFVIHQHLFLQMILMELLVTIDALREDQLKELLLLCLIRYARQDRKSGPRTPISAKLIANLISTAGAMSTNGRFTCWTNSGFLISYR